MSAKLKLLIAGCSNPHIPGYLRNCIADGGRKFQLLGVSESNPEFLENAKKITSVNPDVKFFSDFREMYTSCPDAEAVIIGSDNCDHLEYFRFFTEKQLHIRMMKVISMDHDECLEMVDIGRSYRKIIDCELELRTAPQFLYAREVIRSGKLGKIKSVYLSNISQSPCNYFPNWGNPELIYGKKMPLKPNVEIFRGGAITDHPHPFDLIPWLTGKNIVSVQAVSAPNQRQHLAVEDHAAVTGILENETIFFINPSYSNLEENVQERRLLWPKSLECNLKITGEKGYFSCDYFDRPSFILAPEGAAPNRLLVNPTPRHNKKTVLDQFYDIISGVSAEKVSLEENFAAIRTMNAAYDSIYYGKEIIPEAE